MQLVLMSSAWPMVPKIRNYTSESREAVFSFSKRTILLPMRTALAKCLAAPNIAVTEAGEEKPFMDELRGYAMKLHTKDQAPKDGKASAPKNQPPWKPTKEGYLQFLIESKVVYDAFEDIIATQPQYQAFILTGLERSAALEKDIFYMAEHWGMHAAPAAADGPGASYATYLRDLAGTSPPAFICHFYNFYFAHTAGGRMIGAQVSKAVLDGWMGAFYEWDGDVKEMLGGVREKLNMMTAGWTREEKDVCLKETPKTFKCSGTLLQLISGGH